MAIRKNGLLHKCTTMLGIAVILGGIGGAGYYFIKKPNQVEVKPIVEQIPGRRIRTEVRTLLENKEGREYQTILGDYEITVKRAKSEYVNENQSIGLNLTARNLKTGIITELIDVTERFRSENAREGLGYWVFEDIDRICIDYKPVPLDYENPEGKSASYSPQWENIMDGILSNIKPGLVAAVDQEKQARETRETRERKKLEEIKKIELESLSGISGYKR